MSKRPSVRKGFFASFFPRTNSAIDTVCGHASYCPRHGLSFSWCRDILFELMDQKRRHLVGIAWQFWSRSLRIKPRTHRIVHMDALQRIRVLLVTSLAALLHHGVAQGLNLPLSFLHLCERAALTLSLMLFLLTLSLAGPPPAALGPAPPCTPLLRRQAGSHRGSSFAVSTGSCASCGRSC